MSFNINKPSINRYADVQTQVRQLTSYLERLSDDMNYQMNHLDQSNFANLEENLFSAAVLMAFDERLEELEKRLMAQIKGD